VTENQTIALGHSAAGAQIAVAGAEARQWRVGGRDLLWPGDPATWRQISPILFPVVGWTRDGARIDRKPYPLGLHGFAATQDFVVDARSDDFVRLSMTDNEDTRRQYPFAFRFAVEYRLGDDALEIALETHNTGAGPMPYACGLHPGFRWPFGGGPREGAKVVFEKPEDAEIPAIAPGGLISTRRRSIPFDGAELALTDALFASDALCFLNPRSRSLRFVEAGGASIAMELGDFPHAALWTRPGAPFLCLEAWTGYSDPEGFTGELKDKPGMRILSAGQKTRHAARYVFADSPK
jgi:galactose mutarotase-like enzyme